MRCAFMLYAMLLPPLASAAEDFRVMKLEQEMRNLERQVQTLQRQLGELQSELRRALPQSNLEFSPSTTPSQSSDQTWLSAAKWQRVQLGMSELQVIELLGRPTALRPDAEGRRALLYTLEIGTTGFLSGSVSFVDGKVVEVQKPALR